LPAAGETELLLPCGSIDPNAAALEAPLIGVQCTSILLGHDEASATASLIELHKREAQWPHICKEKPMPIDLPLHLGIFARGKWHGRANSTTDALQQQHLRALEPFVTQAIRRDLSLLLELDAAGQVSRDLSRSDEKTGCHIFHVGSHR
jgi:hypothetical protein